MWITQRRKKNTKRYQMKVKVVENDKNGNVIAL